MIVWKDFVLDDVMGPFLKFEESREAVSDGLCVMDDAPGSTSDPIQETGQELRPARMAGFTSLESVSIGKEAKMTYPDRLRPRERG